MYCNVLNSRLIQFWIRLRRDVKMFIIAEEKYILSERDYNITDANWVKL